MSTFPYADSVSLVQRLVTVTPNHTMDDMSASRAADEVAIVAAVAAARLAGHSERQQKIRERQIRRVLGYTYP